MHLASYKSFFQIEIRSQVQYFALWTLESTFDRQQYNRNYEGQLFPRSETKSNQASAVTPCFTSMQKPYNPLSNLLSYHYAHL
jgi:hypothetical protein